MNTKDTYKGILEKLFNGIYDELQFGIIYGSQINDIDLLLVYRSTPFYKTLLMGNLDCLAYSVDQFEHYISLSDPVITEPMLKNKEVFGDRAKFIKYNEYLKSVYPTEKTISHLLLRSNQSLIDAENSLKVMNGNYIPKLYRLFIKNLKWAISYRAFAKYYLENKTIIKLSDLVKLMDKDIRRFWDNINEIEENDLKTCEKYFHEWTLFIINNTSIKTA